MEIQLTLNGRPCAAEIRPDERLYDLVRAQGCASVK